MDRHDGPSKELGFEVSQTRQKEAHWRLRLREDDGGGRQDWWFASTAIPLIAAAIAPAANVFSIAALVSTWRASLYDYETHMVLEPFNGIEIPDPHWVIGTNVTSLICGYLGNISLFLNFTNRVPYILALPVTVVLWYISFAVLTGIQISMAVYAPPGFREGYTQAFWYGVIASVLYIICASMLLVNMLGYFLGHYPKHFNLTEAQRTLILQTFLFFIWLAGGAGVFQAVQQRYGTEKWTYSDALYFCDVTILTIGYGDLTPDNNLGRGFVLPYSIGGIIMLGLMVSSIATFAREISDANIVQKRTERTRLRTIERTVSSEEQRIRALARPTAGTVADTPNKDLAEDSSFTPKKIERADTMLGRTFKRTGTGLRKARDRRQNRQPSLVVLKEEKDRFEAMRKIQNSSAKFKKWSSLTVSLTVLILLWFIGAVIFWQLEKDRTDGDAWTYFDAMYFCYISLLTIGYGDFTPGTNAGRPFFVLWSLLAVPSITILVSDLADTIISTFQSWTNSLADFTILAKDGIWRELLNRRLPFVQAHQNRKQRREEERRVEEGFHTEAEAEEEEEKAMNRAKTIEQLAVDRQHPRNEHELAKRLANAIKRVASHVKDDKPRRYSYEEWVEYTELIRFTRDEEQEAEEDEQGLIEWDWIGQDGPIMSRNEPSWLLDRLVESMTRYVRMQGKKAEAGTQGEGHETKERVEDYDDDEEQASSSSNGQTAEYDQDADVIKRGQG